jgi:hypothetical protein
MRKFAVSDTVTYIPHLSTGLPLALAGLFMHEFDSGFLPTTNLMHAGYCQFMRIHEGS